MVKMLILLCGSMLLFAPQMAKADVRRLVHQGRVLRPDGTPLSGTFTMEAKIYSPTGTRCLLWGESKPVVFTAGAFAMELGDTAARITGSSGGKSVSFASVFINNAAYALTGATCDSGSTYTPTVNDERNMTVTLYDGPLAIKVYDDVMRSAPYALESYDSFMVGGYDVNHVFKFNESGSTKATLTFSTIGANLLWDLAESATPNLGGKILKGLNEPVDPSDAATLKTVTDKIAALASGTLAMGVTRVDAVSTSSSILSVTGGPITSAGTFSFSLVSQAAGTFLAAPTGAAGTPSFRGIAAVDVPSLDAAKIGSGTLPVARGGTGLGSYSPYAILAVNMTGDAITPRTCANGEVLEWQTGTGFNCVARLSGNLSGFSGTLGVANGGTGLNAAAAANGQLLIGNGSGFALNTLTAGTGITITNTAGSIAISATAGTSGLSQWTNVTGGINYSGGVVGIGTATPLQALDAGTGALRSGALTIAGNPVPLGNPFVVNGQTPSNFIYIDSTYSSLRIGGQGTTGVGNIIFDLPNGATYKDVMALSAVSLNPDPNLDNTIVLGAAGRRWKNVTLGTGDSTFAGNVGIGTTTPSAGLDVASVGTLASALRIPRDTTANRPVAPGVGMMRYNTDLAAYEVYYSTGWASLSGGTSGASPWTSNGSTGISYNAGSVGIGTSSPNAPLSVTSTSTQMQISYDATHFATLGVAGNGDTILNNASGAIFLGPYSGTNRLVVSGGAVESNSATNSWFMGTGNVGIGTQTPNMPLVINTGTLSSDRGMGITYNGADTLGGIIRIGKARSSAAVQAGDELSRLSSTGYDGANYIESTKIASYVDPGASVTAGTVPSSLLFYTMGTNGVLVDRLHINSSGYVGIGTTLPTRTLHVNVNDTTSSVPLAITAPNVGASSSVGMYIGRGLASQSTGFISYSYNTGTASTLNLGNWDVPKAMIIDGLGNVAIGTTAASAGFDVATTGTLGSAIRIPRDSSANRPSSPGVGMMRYNTDLAAYEVYYTTGWASLSAGTSGTSQWTNATTGISYTAGSVGIGVASPTVNLDIQGGGSTAATEYFLIKAQTSTTKGVGIGYKMDGTGANVQEARVRAIGAVPLALGTSNWQQAIDIQDGGSIGFGTIPTAKFDFFGGNNAIAATSGTVSTAVLRMRSNNSAAILDSGIVGGGTVAVWMQATSATDLSNVSTIALQPNGGAVVIGSYAGSYPLSIYNATNSRLQLTNSVTGQTGTDGGLVGMNGSLFDINNLEGDAIRLVQNNVEKMRLDVNGNLAIGTTAATAGLDVATVGTLASAIRIPRDTTANRPSTPGVGMMRYNTDLAAYEVYSATGWASLATGTSGTSQWVTGTTGISYSGGRVAVGTNSPVATFDVQTGTTTRAPAGSGAMFNVAGSLWIDGTTAAAGTAAEANFAAFLPGNMYSSAGVTTTNVNALKLTLAGNGGGETITNTNGLYVSGGYLGVNAATNGYGVNVISPSGASNIYGGNFQAKNVTQSVTTAAALNASVFVSSGSIASAYGLQVAAPNVFSGNLVNYYGVYVATPTAGSVNYAIYSQGGTNYFGGSVGVGTTSPGYMLDVSGTARANIFLTPQVNGSAAAVQIGVGDTNTGLFRATTNQIGVAIAGSEKIRIDNSGNLGIGTTAPAAKLDVTGHLANSGTAVAAITACGSGAAITGNDTRGIASVGTGGVTSCSISFSSPFTTAPICVATWSGSTAQSATITVDASTTALTVRFSTSMASVPFNYFCMQ